MYIGGYVKYSILLEKFSTTKLHEKPSSGCRVFHADEQIDRQT